MAKKIIFFTAGIKATAPELAAIAKLQAAVLPAYELRVFNGVASPNYGAGPDDCDYVAGTVPTAYNAKTVINPDAIPVQSTEAVSVS